MHIFTRIFEILKYISAFGVHRIKPYPISTAGFSFALHQDEIWHISWKFKRIKETTPPQKKRFIVNLEGKEIWAWGPTGFIYGWNIAQLSWRYQQIIHWIEIGKHTHLALSELLPPTPASQVMLDGGSKKTGAKVTDLKDQPGPNVAWSWFVGIHLAWRCHSTSLWCWNMGQWFWWCGGLESNITSRLYSDTRIQGDLECWIWGNWSPRVWSKLDLYPCWSPGWIYWTLISSKGKRTKVALDSGIQGNCAGLTTLPLYLVAMTESKVTVDVGSE